jgi:hypothetical protein
MTILRFAPGDIAPSAGMFALVGHLGEATGISVWRNKGEGLPLIAVAENIGPVWFVQIGSEAPSRLAA